MCITNDFAEMKWLKLVVSVPICVDGFFVDYGLNGVRKGFGQGI